MQRREFITLLGGAAALRPLAAGAQQPVRMRRIGFLWSALRAEDSEAQARGNAFVQGLKESGWSVGRNVRIDYRWGLSDADLVRRSAEELVALAPDVLFAAGSSAASALQRTTRSLPIVFTNVTDPVGAGLVESLARPGSNTTGFMSIEFGQSGKWLELLMQIAPRVTRVAVLRSVVDSGGTSQFAAIQAVAPLLRVEVRPINVRSDSEIERAVSEFAQTPNGGLIVTYGVAGTGRRDQIVALAAKHKLPTVYFDRYFVTNGPSLRVEVMPFNVRDDGEIERAVAAFARSPNGGLIVTSSGLAELHRDLIITLAARHKLPAVYFERAFVAAGGLISYGPDQTDQYRQAAGYVDRILKGEKPADLPVQAPTRYATVLNLKTARALGLDVSAQVLVRADEVIE